MEDIQSALSKCFWYGASMSAVTICSTCCSIQKRVFYPHSASLYFVILDSYYSPKQHILLGLCNGDVVCLL